MEHAAPLLWLTQHPGALLSSSGTPSVPPPLAPGQHGLSTDPKSQAGHTQSTLDPGSQGNHQSQGCGGREPDQGGCPGAHLALLVPCWVTWAALCLSPDNRRGQARVPQAPLGLGQARLGHGSKGPSSLSAGDTVAPDCHTRVCRRGRTTGQGPGKTPGSLLPLAIPVVAHKSLSLQRLLSYLGSCPGDVLRRVRGTSLPALASRP